MTILLCSCQKLDQEEFWGLCLNIKNFAFDTKIKSWQEKKLLVVLRIIWEWLSLFRRIGLWMWLGFGQKVTWGLHMKMSNFALDDNVKRKTITNSLVGLGGLVGLRWKLTHPIFAWAELGINSFRPWNAQYYSSC